MKNPLKNGDINKLTASGLIAFPYHAAPGDALFCKAAGLMVDGREQSKAELIEAYAELKKEYHREASRKCRLNAQKGPAKACSGKKGVKTA